MKHDNQKTRITASVLGVLLGIAGMVNHGLFEVLQGNTPTNGFFIEAIGEAHRFWVYGTEGAVTLIPNFLVTGIAVIMVSLAIIVWSAARMQTAHGAAVFLALLLLLTAIGGGIGHIVLFLSAWAYATRIDKPLDWWRKRLSGRLRTALSRLWIYFLGATALSWLVVLELGIFGYVPGVSDPEIVMNIVFLFLFATVLLANAAFISGIARDLEERPASSRG